MSQPPSGYLSPSEITGKSFETKRRGGIDPESVKQHLAAVAATVEGLADEKTALLDQLATLNDQLARASDAAPSTDELDEDALTERLGQDAARVLAEARAAAADRIAEAETQADDIRAAAEEVFAERSVLADEEANRIREGAEQLVAERQAEAEQAASQIIARAEADAEMTRSSVSGEQQAADADAARIIREAELTRRQILEDLARRRSAARRQIEQLRAGRERLLASHETVRRALDDISEELTISMSEARAAAETAGHNVSETTIEELEAEIETARLTGLLDTGPVPVVSAESGQPPRTPLAPTRFAGSREEGNEGDSATDTSVEDTTTDGTEGAAEVVKSVEPSVTDVSSDIDQPVLESDIPDPQAASQKAGLADVVQLDRARSDVDTATHPATGRDASSGRGSGGSIQEKKPPRLEAVPSKSSTPEAKAEPVEASAPVPDDELEDSVGDLFASLRSTKPKPPAKKPAKKSTVKKATAKKSTSKKGASKNTSKKTAAAAQDDVDSSELTRRLKRVLADEQSRAMSTLKSASDIPKLDDLLGAEAVHVDLYWAEVVGHIDTATSSDTDLRAPVDELVSSIRRRVGAALGDADDDSEVAVASLRNVYREIKTQRVGSCAHSVCQMAAGRSADRS